MRCHIRDTGKKDNQDKRDVFDAKVTADER